MTTNVGGHCFFSLATNGTGAPLLLTNKVKGKVFRGKDTLFYSDHRYIGALFFNDLQCKGALECSMFCLWFLKKLYNKM